MEISIKETSERNKGGKLNILVLPVGLSSCFGSFRQTGGEKQTKKRKQTKNNSMLSTLFYSAFLSSCAIRDIKPKRLDRGLFFLQSAIRQSCEKRLFGLCGFLCHGLREGEFLSLL